jgi:AraC-like DNA-binding protein
MDYKTFVRAGPLASFVKCYWTLEVSATDSQERQRIVPDGCMEMIFHYGDLFFQFLKNGTRITQPRSFVFGQITEALEIAPSGITGVFAVRFHPDGFVPFCDREIKHMENRAVSLEEIYGEAGKTLEQDIINSPNTEARIETIESFLTARLTSPEGRNALAKSTVDLLLKSKGQVSIDLLAAQLQTSRRQLERKFSTEIGLSPKQLSKIIRLQSILRIMGQRQFTNLTELAYEGGYFDQAHFVKDFKEFTGISPKQFYADNMKLSSLFAGME